MVMLRPDDFKTKKLRCVFPFLALSSCIMEFYEEMSLDLGCVCVGEGGGGNTPEVSDMGSLPFPSMRRS